MLKVKLLQPFSVQANIGFIDVKTIATGDWRPKLKTAFVIFFIKKFLFP